MRTLRDTARLSCAECSTNDVTLISRGVDNISNFSSSEEQSYFSFDQTSLNDSLRSNQAFFGDFIHQQNAHRFLSPDEVSAIRENPCQAKRIVHSITRKKLKGSDQQFLEIVDLLLDQGQNLLSLELCTYALLFCAKKGDFFAAQIEALLELNGVITVSSEMIGNFNLEFQRYPIYRLGKAICRLLLSLAEILPGAQQKEYAEKGFSYAETLKKMEPKNEFGYYFEARFLNFIAPYEAEKRLCMYVMLGRPTDPAQPVVDSAERLNCPRCCDLYIRNYLLPRGIETALDLVKDIAEKGSFYSSWLLFQKLPAKEERELKALQESFQEIFQKAVSLTPQIGDCFKNPSQKFSDAGSTYRNNNLSNTIITNKE